MDCCLFASVRRSGQFTLRLPPRRRARYTVSGALPTGAVLLAERRSEMWALSRSAHPWLLHRRPIRNVGVRERLARNGTAGTQPSDHRRSPPVSYLWQRDAILRTASDPHRRHLHHPACLGLPLWAWALRSARRPACL